MLSQSKSVFILLLIPLLFYPLFFSLTFAGDSLGGDGLILQQYQHISRKELARAFIFDYGASLPSSYVLIFIVAVLDVGFAAISKRAPSSWFPLSAGFLAGASAGWLSGGAIGLVAVFAFSCSMVSIVMHAVLRRGLLRHAK